MVAHLGNVNLNRYGFLLFICVKKYHGKNIPSRLNPTTRQIMVKKGF
jgi:hypothetical protein